jgi:polyphosphate kinase 2 (PPK2 family)
VWRRFFTRVLAGPTPTAEDEMAEYLERHQRDLPPALRIELERRSMSL